MDTENVETATEEIKQDKKGTSLDAPITMAGENKEVSEMIASLPTYEFHDCQSSEIFHECIPGSDKTFLGKAFHLFVEKDK